MPKKINFSKIEDFFHKKNLGFILNFSDKGKLNVNEMTASDPFKPDLYDLYRLYQFVVLMIVFVFSCYVIWIQIVLFCSGCLCFVVRWMCSQNML